MATPTSKGKIEKEIARLHQRKASVPEAVTLEDLMRQLLKVSETQRIMQRSMQEEITKMRKEISGELGGVKRDLNKVQQTITEIKQDKQKLEQAQGTMQEKMEKLEAMSVKLEARQERLEQREMEFQLRFRNIQEDPGENIREIICQMTAELTKRPREEMMGNIEKAYRITTSYSRKNKVARDVIVHFARRTAREEVLKGNSKNPPLYQGRKVSIMKEHPLSTLIKRRKYAFLAEELRRLQIRFRWERKEGMMVTYKEEKIWITSEDKAKEFMKRLKRDTERERTPGEESGREAKKARYVSPVMTTTEAPRKSDDAPQAE